MALAVASTSSTSSDNAASLVLTKPTGVSVGDLLVIIAAGEHDGNNGTDNSTIACTGFTKQLQPARENNNSNTDRNVAAVFLWRIADSSDVSASNYTVTNYSTQTLGVAAMFRITGWTTGNPIYSSRSENGGYVSSGFSLSRVSPQLLIMANVIKEDSRGYSFASPTMTSSDSNPTWTEVVDANVVVNQDTDTRRISMAVYYANSSALSNITAYTVTETAVIGSLGGGGSVSFLAVLCEPLNATASNAVFQNSNEYFSPLTASTQEPSNDFQAIEPEFFTQSATATNPTQWVNEENVTTDWTNESL